MAAGSASSLTRLSTKSALPDSDTMLDERLGLALSQKSMSGSAGASWQLIAGSWP